VPGEFIDAPEAVEASAIALPPCSSVVTVRGLPVHTAYSVTLELIVNVLDAARAVPLQADPAAGWVVHQPPNEYPVLARVPVSPATVTVALVAYPVASVGDEPDEGELPS
jgi:hypothetical protein